MSEQPTDRPGIAESMRDLAEIFREGANADGFTFGYEPNDAAKLDLYFDMFLEQNPPEEAKHTHIVSGGAYVGELLVRLAGARWSEANQSEPTIVLANGMEGRPLDKVAKRVHVGPMHSLAQYVEFVLTGADPHTFPGAKIHDLRADD